MDMVLVIRTLLSDRDDALWIEMLLCRVEGLSLLGLDFLNNPKSGCGAIEF